MIIIYYILNILTDAAGDALNERHIKHIGHLLQALSVFILLIIPMYFHISWLDIVGYILLRLGLFDIIHNIVKKDSLFYHGKSSWLDFWNMVKAPPTFELFGKVIFITMGVSMILSHIKPF